MGRSPQLGDAVGDAEARLQAAAQAFPSQNGPDAATLSAEPWRMLIDAHVANLHSHNGIIKEMYRLASLGLPGAVLLFQDLDIVRSRAERMLEDATKARNAVDEYLRAPTKTSQHGEANKRAQATAHGSKNETTQPTSAKYPENIEHESPRSPSQPYTNPYFYVDTQSVPVSVTEHSASTTTKPNSDAHQGEDASSRLHLGNCPYQATVDDFRTFFTGYQTQAINVPVNPRTQRAVGYAFVTLGSAAEAQRAVAELNGKTMFERKISVQIARPDPNDMPKASRTRSPSVFPEASDSSPDTGRATPAPTAGPGTHRPNQRYVPGVQDISATVYMCNLPVRTGTDDIVPFFALTGYHVRNVDTYCMFHATHESFYAFVTLHDADEVQRAIAELHYVNLEGRRALLEPASLHMWPRIGPQRLNNSGVERVPTPAVEYDDITAEVNARLAATRQRKREARAWKRERKRKRMSGDSVISDPAADNADFHALPPLPKRPRQFWDSSLPMYPQDEGHGRLSPVDGYTPHRVAKREWDDGYGAESPAAKRIKVEPV